MIAYKNFGRQRGPTAEQHGELATSEKLADDDFRSMSDDEIGSLLRASWEYEKQAPFEILGRITRTITKLGKTIYLLTDLRNPKNGAVLRNPYDRPGLRLGEFVHRSEAERLYVTFAEEPWVKAQAVLSRVDRLNQQPQAVIESSWTGVELKENCEPRK